MKWHGILVTVLLRIDGVYAVKVKLVWCHCYRHVVPLSVLVFVFPFHQATFRLL